VHLHAHNQQQQSTNEENWQWQLIVGGVVGSRGKGQGGCHAEGSAHLRELINSKVLDTWQRFKHSTKNPRKFSTIFPKDSAYEVLFEILKPLYANSYGI